MTRRAALAPLAALSLAAALRAAPAAGQASPAARYAARYAAATAAGDAAAAVEVLREAARDPAMPAASRRGAADALPVAEARLAMASGDAFRAVEILRGALRDRDLPPASRGDVEAALRAAEARLAADSVAPPPRAPAAPPARPETTRGAPPPPPPVLRVVVSRGARSWTPTAGPVALWSLGAASLGAALALGLARDAALAPCTVGGGRAVCASQGDLDRARDSVGLATGANVALGVGLTALAAGTAWWLLDGRAPVPVVTAEGASVTLTGRW